MATAIHPNQHKLIARAREFLAEVEDLLVWISVNILLYSVSDKIDKQNPWPRS